MKENEISGYILLNKKSGITSFSSLEAIKKTLHTRKVGHTGTLDKFATGLLIALVGKASKLSPYFLNCDKKYQGTILFGTETDTLDSEGNIIAEGKIPLQEEIQEILPQFTGKIMQSPPEYSAIHIQGKRASDLARKQTSPANIEMQKRQVTVYKLVLCSYNPPNANIFVHCSKGTYIRSLARDIAHALNTHAHLISLNRTHIADFSLEEAHEQSLKTLDKTTFEKLHIPYLEVSDKIAIDIIHGKPLEKLIAHKDEKILAIFRSSTKDFIGIIENKDKVWQYGYVYARHQWL